MEYSTGMTAHVLVWAVPVLVIAYILWSDEDKWKF